MAKHVIFLVLLVCAALQAQANIELQDHKQDEAALEVDTMGASDECQYTLAIKTGTWFGAGTGSKLRFGIFNGREPAIEKVIDAVLLTGSLDTFEFKDKCRKCLCYLRINSDWETKYGIHPNWYCDWVSITIKGEGRKTFTHKWKVDQWLGPRRKKSLYADDCADVLADKENCGPSSFSII